MLSCPDSINHLVGILSGDFSPEFIYFTNTMAASPSTSNKDAVLIISTYSVQPAQISGISVYGESAGNYLNATLTSCSSV